MSDCISYIKTAIGNNATLITQADELIPYHRGTEGLEGKTNIIAVVKAYDKKDVESLLLLANELANQPEFKFTIYPISTGLNWGYGTSQPPKLDIKVVILDLSGLTQIEFDEDLGLVTVEPGVTQQLLSDFFISNGDNFMVPVTGAGPNASIVGNAIERGYGITPYTDHFGAVTAVQGYWANARHFCSAVNELDKSHNKTVDKTFKWGLGPYLDGLFTQSNLGVVTQMSIRMARKPQKFISFIMQVPDDKALEIAIPLIRKILRDYEGIVGSINLMDKRRVLSMFAENPNPGEHKVMSPTDIAKLSKAQQTPSWTIMGSIYGSNGVAKTVKKEIKRIFKALPCRQIFSDSPIFSIGNAVINTTPNFLFKLAPFLALIKEQLASFERGKEIMLGRPNNIALKLAYWRHKNAKRFPADNLSPGKDGCGVLWYAPLVTMKPNIMREYVDFIRATCPKFNIEPLITFTNLKHDCVDSTIPILFDLSDPDAVKDAHNCLKELVLEGVKLGYIPYRLNIDQQQWLLDANSPFWHTVNDIKSVVDPNNILSMGRYNPR
ncbi:FAD-binding protein [Colwellia psychrerythraea]|uniref:FAD-binding protein n=1 Tax=Colwellia psychrerythraea (strain 34H / ATCC BAA-681) TaxID=167879 RepID=Q489I0_COLP3|nr:FAD-binding protein [Colwellia psychrerythraea]AAZ26639.1 FAD-binding protein [Colwellia psychrerythraea 34H]